MNLPNKICLIRIILVPIFAFFLMMPTFGITGRYVALIIFIIASCTDWIDGRIARKYNLVTDLGKFLDPLADKLLVCTALICLTALGEVPFWFTAVVVARELAVTGLRAVAAASQIVIAASYWGKFKTAFQMAAIIALLLGWTLPFFTVLTQLLIWVACLLTVISAVDYFYKNRQVFQDT